jgi:hypothetical protein
MKVRIKGDSLRLRLSRSEVSMLLAGDGLEETIHFGPEASAKFTFGLQQDSLESQLKIKYAENKVTIRIPANQAHLWGATDQVGIAEDINLGPGKSLALLIEKDFACFDRSELENEDTFPNPNAGAAC